MMQFLIQYINFFLIALSLSLDTLGVGISYELKNIKVTWRARWIVGIISFLSMTIALYMGNSMTLIFPTNIVKAMGVFLLIGIGLTFLASGIKEQEETHCDLDGSLDIDNFEAVVLGIAVSVDAFSAGLALGAAKVVSLVIPMLVGIMQMVFIYMGAYMLKSNKEKIKEKQKLCSCFSGILLICIALFRIIL